MPDDSTNKVVLKENNTFVVWVDIYTGVAFTIAFILFALFYFKTYKQKNQLSGQLKVILLIL